MERIIRRKLGDPVSEDSMERVRRLAEMPDELINTEDIPARPIGSGRRVYPLRDAQSVGEQRKAS